MPHLLLPLMLVLRFLHAVRAGWRDPDYRALSFWVLTLLGVGTVFYHHAEGWAWFDALYFSVITLTTVGYGDLAPTSTVSRLFTIIYIMLGLSVFAGFIQVTASKQRELRQSRHSEPDSSAPVPK